MRNLWQLWKSNLTPEECNIIIENAKQYPQENGNIFAGGDNVAEVRRSHVRWLTDNEYVKALVMKYGTEANRKAFGFEITDVYDIQFTEYYAKEQGFYDWHHDVDFTSDSMSDRKITVVIQLSDPSTYEGGNFSFKDVENPDFTPQGSIIVFPSFLEHKVYPITKGVRYSLAAWIEGPRWK